MRTALASLIVALAALPVSAQDVTDDWALTVDQSRNLMLATAAYSTGQTIAVRCQAGVLDVLVTALPVVAGRSRFVETTVGERPTERGWWFSGEAGAAILSATPAPTARSLRAGGRLRLSVALDTENDGPMRRYAFDLPGQSASLDRVLDACGTPKTDARDDLPRWMRSQVSVDELWSRRAFPEFPIEAINAGIGSGYAVLSCVIGADGRSLQCQVESESDRRAGFGRSALRAMSASRVSLTAEGGPRPGELAVFMVFFQHPR
jgi:hypothetical protein